MRCAVETLQSKSPSERAVSNMEFGSREERPRVTCRKKTQTYN